MGIKGFSPLPVMNEESVSTKIVDDPQYGKYLSGFVPIKDKQGKIIGILGVDINADEVGAIGSKVVAGRVG